MSRPLSPAFRRIVLTLFAGARRRPRASAPSLKGQGAFHVDTFEALDASIAILADNLSSLKSRRNALTPVSRMPPELFSRCFTLVVKSSPNSSDGGYELISITHVCRHWRNIALSDHTLWSTLDYANPRLAHYMLLRAGRSALSLAFPEGMDRVDAEARSAIAARSGQIESLQIHASRSSLVTDFMPVIQGAASCLLRLQYADAGVNFGFHADPIHPLSFVPTPNLRELRLSNFFPSRTLPQMYAKLTCLCIQNDCSTVHQSLLLRLSDLLAMLAQLPLIADLTVEQSGETTGQWIADPQQPPAVIANPVVRMHALRVLSISDALHTALGPALLKAIHAPNLQYVYCAWADASEVWSFRELTQWWEAWSSRPLVTLEMGVRQWYRVHEPPSDSRCDVGLRYSLQRGTSSVADADQRYILAPSPTTTTYPLSLSIRARAATPMTNIVPRTLLAEVSSLEITVATDHSQPRRNPAVFGTRTRIWAKSAPWGLLASSRLAQLALDTNPCWSLLYFFQHLPSSIAPNTLFPMLRAFTLIGADFDPQYYFVDAFGIYDEANNESSILEPFTAWVIRRKTCGVPVKELVFDRCKWYSQQPSRQLLDAVCSLRCESSCI